MFITRTDLFNSLRALKSIEEFESEDSQFAIAECFARDIYPEYDRLSEDKKQEFIDMIILDMSIDALDIN